VIRLIPGLGSGRRPLDADRDQGAGQHRRRHRRGERGAVAGSGDHRRSGRADAFCGVLHAQCVPGPGPPGVLRDGGEGGPLGVTVSTAATSSATVATPDPLSVPSARPSMMAPMPTVSTRSGRSRLPDRADQYPTASRAAAPPTTTTTAANSAPCGRGPAPLLDQVHQPEGCHRELWYDEQRRDQARRAEEHQRGPDPARGERGDP